MTVEPTWIPALLGTATEDGRLRCDLCPHHCVLAPHQVGRCRVRRHEHGRLETAAYATVAEHVTSIERKPLYHFRPGTAVLTIAAPGCTFRCNYCLNFEVSQYGRVKSLPWTGVPAEPAALVARAADARASIGLSYTEATLALELVLDLAGEIRARRLDIPLVWKTNGFLAPAALELVAPVLSAVNVDIKAAEDAAHRRLTGADLAPVWKTIEGLIDAGVWVEVSTPLVPGTASEPQQWRSIAETLAAISPDIPWHLVRFTPDYRLAETVPTPPEDLRQAAEIGRAAGLRYVYVERALGAGGRRTTCPACQTAVIERDVWALGSCALTGDGRCPTCSYPIPGRWE